MKSNDDEISMIRNVFRDHKAEWLENDVYSLFQEPSYFDALRSRRPSVLVGGRGSGKTTALMSLSYEGQHALNATGDLGKNQYEYIGFYHRVNTTRTSTLAQFQGNEKSKNLFFCHYLNLVMCQNIARFLIWYEGQEKWSPDNSILNAAAKALNINDSSSNAADLDRLINITLSQMASSLNDDADSSNNFMSVLGAPVELLINYLKTQPEFKNSTFLYILDEYENFQEYQQEIVNSLIKHASPTYTFKIGIREFGFKTKKCYGTDEELEHPADYSLLQIEEKFTEKSFSDFAKKVAHARIQKCLGPDQSLEELFPKLNVHQEAEELGKNAKDYQNRVNEVSDAARKYGAHDLVDEKPIHKFILSIWAAEKETSIQFQVNDYIENPKKWKNRFGNYAYEALFQIRKGKSGIVKYYCGLQNFATMSGRNIRNFLELIESALVFRYENSSETSNYATQTLAAIYVGKRRIRDIQERSLQGGTIARLVLSLGALFRTASSRLNGFPPETVSFTLAPSTLEEVTNHQELEDLLQDSTKHLALIRSFANKLRSKSDLSSNEYQLHPLFAAFFKCSHRKKRAISLSYTELNELVNNPRRGIQELAAKQSYNPIADDTIQLELL